MASLRHSAVTRYLWTSVCYSQGPGPTVQLPGQHLTASFYFLLINFFIYFPKVTLWRKRIVQVFKLLPQNFGVRAGSQQCSEAGDVCAICQAEFRDPVALLCQVRRGRL